MNFLLIPKNGNPRFHTGNPFYYIEKRGMIPVKDYFDFFDENMSIIGDALTVNHVFTDEEDYEYYFIIFNKDGDDKRLDRIGNSDMNVIASNFYNAYNRQYVGNYTKIYSDAILVKTTAGRKIEDMSVEDKNNIRGMLKDAEWVEQYLDRDEWYKRQ